jgi:GGDEF domain-containing protein
VILSKFLAVVADIPARYLDSITRGFCVALLLGLAVKSVLLSHWALSAILVVLAGIILVNIIALHLEREAFIPLWMLVTVLTATVILTTCYVGLSGATWMFPTLVGLRFAAPPSQYQPARLVLIAVVPLVVLLQGDPGNAARLLAAGLITSAYLWLAEGEIVSLRSRLDGDDGRDPVTRAFSRARMEQDKSMIASHAPVGLVVVRLDGLMDLRVRGEGARADDIMASVAAAIIPLLSTRERLYRLGGSEFLIGLAGWRAFECFELGQTVCKTVQPHLPKGVRARSGVAEVTTPQDFDAALDLASSMVSKSGDLGRSVLSTAL